MISNDLNLKDNGSEEENMARRKAVPVVDVELVKKKVRVPTFEEETRVLAKDSADILGYRVMQTLVSVKRPLAQALRRLHIRAFTPESVKEYQDQKRKEQQAKVARNVWVTWQSIHIGDYQKQIPEFVLRKAIQIKEEVPKVQFVVEELNEKAIDPDPFLWAITANERFCIEVWNEPAFEDKVLNGLIETVNLGSVEDV